MKKGSMMAFVAAAVLSDLPASGWARPATPPEAGSFRYLPQWSPGGVDLVAFASSLPHPKSPNYRALSPERVEAFVSFLDLLFEAFDRSQRAPDEADWCGAQAAAERAGYQLFRLFDIGIDDRTSQSHRRWFLYARDSIGTGHAHFFVNLSAKRDLVIEAPHSGYDLSTDLQAAHAFLALSARVLVLNGADRYSSKADSICPDSGSQESDVAHDYRTTFFLLHRHYSSASRRTKFLQFHGFGTAAGDVQVSDGSTRDDQDPNPSSVSVSLRDALRLIAPNKTIFSCQVDAMGGGRKLCGTTNLEGRSSNEARGADECRAPTAQSTDRFLHLEQVRTFRNLDVEQHLVERALSIVWGDCNLAEDAADCDLGDPQPSFADYSCLDHIPLASAGPNRTVECASPSGTSVLLDATASSDPDGDPITYQWSASQGTLESPNEPLCPAKLPLGRTVVQVAVEDGRAPAQRALAIVVVADRTPPELRVDPAQARVCVPRPQPVALPTPSTSDMCSPEVSQPKVRLVEVHGKAIAPIDLQPSTAMPLGASVVEWSAFDPSGNLGMARQSLVISPEEPSSCCGTLPPILENGMSGLLPCSDGQPVCLLGKDGGASLVSPRVGSSLLFGGPGDDQLFCQGAGDTAVGGEGNDQLFASTGDGAAVTLAGGLGNDVLFQTGQGPAALIGGDGDDWIAGGAGADLILPGSGADRVLAGPGDDRVVVYDACELQPGEILDGGAGEDTLVIPVPLEALRARGLLIFGFEKVVVDSSKSYLSECY